MTDILFILLPFAMAKQRGEIASVRTVLHQLRQAGMYLSDAVMNRALQLVEE